jgi:protein-disulfide isomerase
VAVAHRRAPARTEHDRRPTLSQQRPAPVQRQTRRERREAERRGQQRPAGAAARPFWQSPMVLLTGAAAIVAVIVIGFAMLSTGQIATGDLKKPTDPTPESVWDGRAVGSADAPLTLAVYSDFQCPACDVFATQSGPQLIRDYVEPGKLRIVYKDFSFIGPESFEASVAARCAGDQGLFWPYHDYLFANQKGENKGAFDRNRLIAMGEAVGVDQAPFTACLDTQAPLDATKAETVEGQALGVTSTPTLFLGDQKIVGVPAYETLAGAIDSALAGASPAASPAP